MNNSKPQLKYLPWSINVPNKSTMANILMGVYYPLSTLSTSFHSKLSAWEWDTSLLISSLFNQKQKELSDCDKDDDEVKLKST